MLKLLLVVALCLFQGIAPSDVQNGNVRDQDEKSINNTDTLSPENSFEDLVTTTLQDSEIQSTMETDSIPGTQLEELPSTFKGYRDLFRNEEKLFYGNQTEGSMVNSESILIGVLPENSSIETKEDENISFIRASNTLYSPTENISVISTVLKASYLTTINADEESEQTLTAEIDKTSNQSNLSSNVGSTVYETSTIFPKTEAISEYSIRSSTPQEYLEEETNFPSSSTTAVESLKLKSSFSREDVEPLTYEENNFSNPSVGMSHGDEFSSVDDSTTSSTTFTSENSESYLMAKTVRETFEDTDTTITPERKFTLNESISQKKGFANDDYENRVRKLIDWTNDEDENSTYPTIDESSTIYEDENYFVENATQDNSKNYFLNVNEKNTFLENSTIDYSPVNLDKLATNISLTPEVLFSTHFFHPTLHTRESSEKVSLVSTPNSTKLNISDNASEKTALPPSKETFNHIYKLIVKRDCSGDVLSSKSIQSVNEILNRRVNAQNSTVFEKCLSVHEFNFTSDIATLELFNDTVNVIQETMGPVIEVTIVNYSSILYNVSHNPHGDSKNFVVSKLVVYIVLALALSMVLFMILVMVWILKRCKKNSSSLNLSDIPHVALSVNDYKVTPIPRPSISFPETNREFLYAYSNETYSRAQDDVITKRHYSDGVGKEIEASKMKKEKLMTLEMETFARKGHVGRNRPDSKSAPDYEYASAGYWDRLKGRGVTKNQGLDNPSLKW